MDISTSAVTRVAIWLVTCDQGIIKSEKESGFHRSWMFILDLELWWLSLISSFSPAGLAAVLGSTQEYANGEQSRAPSICHHVFQWFHCNKRSFNTAQCFCHQHWEMFYSFWGPPRLVSRYESMHFRPEGTINFFGAESRRAIMRSRKVSIRKRTISSKAWQHLLWSPKIGKVFREWWQNASLYSTHFGPVSRLQRSSLSAKVEQELLSSSGLANKELGLNWYSGSLL